jgi:tRNA(Ile)-lysidine synthase
MDVLSEIRRACLRHDLLPHGEMIVVGVSGGPDSLCLLHALLGLRDEFGVELHVAHLDHRLRGVDAEADAEFVRDLAARRGLACTVAARDVAALSRAHKLSIEEAARQARYAFLAEVALARRSHTIAVAHNADDQAESVLMHFIRGSGSAGLRGMLPKADLSEFRLLPPTLRFQRLSLIRPMLCVPRADVERYCHEHDLRPRFDVSNLDTTFFRNRLRHELLPLLESYNPNIRQVLRRTAEVMAAEVETLRAALQNAWRAAIVSEPGDAITFRREVWHDLPLALQRATLREAIRRLRPSLRNVNFIHIEDAVSHLRQAQAGARITLPQNLAARVDYETFTVGDAAHEPALPNWPLWESRQTLPVNAPGLTPLPDSDWLLEATYLDSWGDEVFANPDRWTAYLDAGALGPDLSLRARAPGDVFHPHGMPEALRLANWMTNAKIPRRIRDCLPLIAAGDRIAWVAGFRVGQPFVVKPGTHRVARLSFRRQTRS